MLSWAGPGPGPAPCAGAIRRWAGWEVHRGAGGASEGPAHGAGSGPGPADAGINRYSAQEGINSKGNIIDIQYPIIYIYSNDNDNHNNKHIYK